MELQSKTFLAIPPGETIREQLEDRGISQRNFAQKIGYTEKHISNLLNGKTELSHEAAHRLEMVLGIPATYWMSLEASYRDTLIKVSQENQSEADLGELKKYPYAEMVHLGWVPAARDPWKRVTNLRQFFEVFSLVSAPESALCCAFCRRISRTEKSDYAFLAWSKQAEREARKINCAPINYDKLNRHLAKFRKMTRDDPELFLPILIDDLSECGVALVVLPHLKGSFLHGATFKSGKKIVVGVTIRGKDSDRFWFSLFHEIGHILCGHLDSGGRSDIEETEADNFASEWLIPESDYRGFVAGEDYTRDAIISFADAHNILAGIVVGRLQRDHYIPYSRHNDLKTKYMLQ